VIYLNGDGFAAASYANCNFSYSGQDETHSIKGKLIHPKNIDVSFGKLLSLAMHQPLSIEAWQFNVHSKIFRETYQAIKNNNVSYVIITWPNLFRDEVLVDNRYYAFPFNGIDNLDCNDNIKKEMFEKMKSFQTSNAQLQFENNIKKLCDFLNSKRIKHLMIQSDSKLPVGNANWLWADDNIASWATKNKLLNSFGFLNKDGHQSLFKLIFDNLTNQ